MHWSKLGSKVRARIKRALLGTRPAPYPLVPDEKVRRGVVRFPIGSRAWIEVFWKEIEFGTGPAFSLFADRYEILRFDCSGKNTGHFHVANEMPFCRIWMYEQEMTSQIERGLFEIQKNHAFYLKQNPIAAVREIDLDSEQLGCECANARRKLLEYAERFSRSHTAQPISLSTESQD